MISSRETMPLQAVRKMLAMLRRVVVAQRSQRRIPVLPSRRGPGVRLATVPPRRSESRGTRSLTARCQAARAVVDRLDTFEDIDDFGSYVARRLLDLLDVETSAVSWTAPRPRRAARTAPRVMACPTLVHDADAIGWAGRPFVSRRLLVMPIRGERRLLGTLEVMDPCNGSFTPDDLHVLGVLARAIARATGELVPPLPAVESAPLLGRPVVAAGMCLVTVGLALVGAAGPSLATRTWSGLVSTVAGMVLAGFGLARGGGWSGRLAGSGGTR